MEFYCVFTEIFGGLGVFHTKYWSLRTGAKRKDGPWRLFGNLVKSVVIKIFISLTFVSLILLSIVK